MRTLAIVQVIIAAAFLLVGIVALFGIGITGLIILVPGIAFAAIAGLAQDQSRGAVVLALAVDAVIAFFAIGKLQQLLNPALTGNKLEPAVAALLKPTAFDFLVPSAALVLVTGAAIAVLLDWRSVRDSPWF